MLSSQDSLAILERIIRNQTNDSLDGKLATVSFEERNLIQNLIDNYSENNNSKLVLILKIFLSYLNFINTNQSIKSENFEIINDIIKSVRFNEIEVFIPCKNVEWVLLEIGKSLLSKNQKNLQNLLIIDRLFETTNDLFKIVNNNYGLAVSNYLLAYRWYLNGNTEKSSRLLEMVSHLFEEPIFKWETQYYAALMNYESNLRRAINLLENCLLVQQKYPQEISKSKIRKDTVEETLNKLRREYIIREHDNQDKSFLFKVIDNVIHYYYNKNDLYGLSACYYESGIIFEKLGYEDTAEEYFVESAIITSDLQEWKLYSKALINLVVKFFEKGRIKDAEDYLNDLIQVASYLKDKSLHKKVETLLVSLKKLKEIRQPHITNETKIEEYISELEESTQEFPNSFTQEQPQNSIYETNLNPQEDVDLLNSLDTLSRYEPENQEANQNLSNSNQSVSVDKTFLTDFKEPITPQVQNEVIISNEELLPPETTPPKKKEDDNSFHAVRKRICRLLKDNNYEIFTDYKPVKGSVSVDIVASRGKIRKQKLFIMIASDSEPEIELSSNLLVSIFDSAERIVYVISDTKFPKRKKGAVSIIYNKEDLPK